MALPRNLHRRATEVVRGVHGHVELILSLALMGMLGFVWIAILPAWQTPDEPDHAAYAERLAQQSPWELRIERTSFSDALFQSILLTQANGMFHDPTYKGEFDPELIAENERELSTMSKADRSRDGALGTRAAFNPPLQYALIAVLLRASGPPDYHSEIYLPRVVSLLMAMTALVFQYLTLRLVFSSRGLVLLGMSVLALMPMYAASHVSPNPDNALGLFFSVALWLAVRTVRTGMTWRTNVAFALAVAGAMLSKSTGAALLPLYATTVLVLLGQRRVSIRSALVHSALFSAIVLALVGWFYVGAVGVAAGEVMGKGRTNSMSFPEYLKWATSTRLEGIFNEYWGVYGWLDTSVDGRLYRAVQIVVACSTAGLGVLAIRAGRSHRVDPVTWIVLAAIVPLFVVLIPIDFSHVSSGLEPNGFIQGRYFMPLTSALVLVLVVGVSGLVRSEYGRRIAAVMVVPALGAFHVITLAQFVIPRYYL